MSIALWIPIAFLALAGPAIAAIILAVQLQRRSKA
jgi:hypothetical protein